MNLPLNPERWEEVPTNIVMLPSMVDGKFYPYQGKVYRLKKEHYPESGKNERDTFALKK